MLRITTLSQSDDDAVTSLMTLAFSGDPVTRWRYPDPRQYLTYYPILVRLYAGAALNVGTAHAVGDCQGIAMWLPPGVEPDEQALGELRRQSVAPELLTEIFDLVQTMASYHPAEPHWFLPLIGVDPVCQGKGYGSALLAHMVAQFDRDRQLAYLENTNPKNVPLYERHGFERLGVIQSGSCPPIYPMLRKPR